MKSLAELKAIKEKTQNEISMRNAQDGMRIIVGMATCGIAAGARPVMNAFMRWRRKATQRKVSSLRNRCG